jgi:hypothetical protein
MKAVARFYLVLLLVCAGSSLARGDITIFSANFDNGLNADISPGPAWPALTANDVNTVASGPNYNSSLLAPQATDSAAYLLHARTDSLSSWFPTHGRISLKMKVVALPPQNFTINIFDLAALQYPANDVFALFMLRNPNVGGTSVELAGADLNYFGSDPPYGGYHWYSADNIPGDPLSTVGWHTIVTEWNEVAAWDYYNNYNPETLNISVYVDGQLVLNAPTAYVGYPGLLEQLYIGAYHNASANSIGAYGGLIDDVKIEEIIGLGPQYCGDNGTSSLKGDLNGDCHVDFKDVLIFIGQWLECSNPLDSTCDQFWK